MALRRTWVCLLAGLLAACGGGDDEPDDDASSAGSAGTAGVAGVAGMAGKSGAAGASGSGVAGKGGTAGGTGGQAGKGGGSTAGAGGSAGKGGASGGAAGTGGAGSAGAAGTGGAAAGAAGTGGAAAGAAGTGGAAAGAAGAGTCAGTAFLASLGKDRVLVGGAMEDATLAMAPFDVRYQYLSGGFPDGGTCASCASGCTTKGTTCDNKGPGCNWWGCWQWDQVPPGQYVKDFITETKKAGAVPMLTYYEQLQDSGAAEGKGQLASLTDPKITKRYYDDVRFLAQTIGSETVLVHLEPDLWGYFLQMGSPDPANVKVATASASADCAGQPENAKGFAGCLIGILRKHAPNAKIALHASPWATNIDAVSNTDASVDVTAEAQKLAAHLAKLGALDGDFLVVDLSDRDAGFDQKNGEDTWMDATNTKLPHFHQAFTWVKALGAATKMPILWWQLPLGNAQQNDTTNHWKDNRVEYFFSHVDEVAQSNVIGILFGSGEPQQTNPETDGGFFVSRAKDHFAAGGVAPICPLARRSRESHPCSSRTGRLVNDASRLDVRNPHDAAYSATRRLLGELAHVGPRRGPKGTSMRSSRISFTSLSLVCALSVACSAGPPDDGDSEPAATDPGGDVTAEREQAVQNGANDTGSPLNDAVVGFSGGGWCSATLVSAEWALTAAHCVAGWNGSGGWVGVGVNSATWPGASTVPIDGCFMHPTAFAGRSTTPWRCGTVAGSAWMTVPYDLALVHLSRPVPRASARPMRVLLSNPRSSYSAWAGQSVTLRGWGVAGPYGGTLTQPSIRQVGTNLLDGVGPDSAWIADRTSTGGTALTLSGDSGGPLIWYPTPTTPTIIGTASGGNSDGVGTVLSYWSNTTLPAAAAWINSVMSQGTDASAQVTSGSVSPPASGWRGEGTDSPQGDNCPNRFNPWQSDADNDGIGDECDFATSPTWAWGAASFAADGRTLSSFNTTGAPIRATPGTTGVYSVSMKQLGMGFGNVQVVATGTSPTRCKVAGWYQEAGGTGAETIDVRCHDAAGAPAASPFVVYLNGGAAGQQGAHLYYDGGSVWSGYSWNGTGAANTVTRAGVGRYTVSYPGMTTYNTAVHVTAYGTSGSYCNIESWGLGSASVACFAPGGAPADSAFSFLVSPGATRSNLIGGHAWVNAATSADPGYQRTVPVMACDASAPVAVSGYANVTYANTALAPYDPTFPLTTAYGYGNSGYCKVESWSTSGTATTVRTKCFTAAGAATTFPFTQSFLAASMQGPC